MTFINRIVNYFLDKISFAVIQKHYYKRLEIQERLEYKRQHQLMEKATTEMLEFINSKGIIFKDDLKRVSPVSGLSAHVYPKVVTLKDLRNKTSEANPL